MADKNAGMTLMPAQWYIGKVKDHLDEGDTYRHVKAVPIEDIVFDLSGICNKYQVDEFLMRKFAFPEIKIRNPQFYMMPKIHKTPIGIRPIIPSHSWYTTNVVKW